MTKVIVFCPDYYGEAFNTKDKQEYLNNYYKTAALYTDIRDKPVTVILTGRENLNIKYITDSILPITITPPSSAFNRFYNFCIPKWSRKYLENLMFEDSDTREFNNFQEMAEANRLRYRLLIEANSQTIKDQIIQSLHMGKMERDNIIICPDNLKGSIERTLKKIQARKLVSIKVYSHKSYKKPLFQSIDEVVGFFRNKNYRNPYQKKQLA